MRAEKQYLVDEVRAHLGKSDYVYLANYERITVAQTAELRKALKACGAEYHVVKNSTLAVALKETSYPSLEGMLAGQTAIIVGGKNPSEVAKALVKFFKATEKIVVTVLAEANSARAAETDWMSTGTFGFMASL
jgi:large subunit ribosomal protein L10